MIPRYAALSGALLAGSVLPGCTLLGAGIGAGIDSAIPGPYHDEPANERHRLAAGDRVVLGLRDGKRVGGRYLGVHGPTPRDVETYLLIDSDDRVKSVAASEIRVVGVETTGKGWMYGAFVGLALDTAAVVAIAISVATMDSGGGWGGEGACLLCSDP